MALQLSHAVSDGIRRTVSRTGGILLFGFLAIQFGLQTSANSAVLGLIPPEAAEQFSQNAGITLPIPGSVGVALFVVLVVLSSTYFVVLSRTFARPQGEMSRFPATLRRRLGRTTVFALVGGLIVTVSIMLGTVLLILPGLFLAASFLFFIFGVAVEDRGIISSLKRSWGLARGSRIKLGILVVVTALFGGIIGAITPLLTLAGLPVVADVVTVVLTTVFFVPYYAIIASAYLQLRNEEDAQNQSTQNPVDASQTPKL
ncbi:MULTISPECIES: hypothetical protein [Halorubrum]|nr:MULTISPECIES: hypothetical protein [Halorubrum]RLM63672.1 hypothetical protein DVK07_16040 [Halorubrum sp. Atlit-26R]